jgi:hypothetical protein
VVAYPQRGDYVNDTGARRPLLDLDDILREDLRQLRDAIGVNGYSTLDAAGGNATVFREDVRRDVDGDVVFLVLGLATMYREAMP